MSVEPKLNAPVTHVITLDDATAWLADHGFDADNVRECRIEIGNVVTRDGERVICAWLDVEWYRLDSTGQKYLNDERTDAVTASSSVPLRSWPPLTSKIDDHQ
ncbi:hypothetical protein [Pseudonocardia parietis]|uniref:Uncharacterized protein n=1 Tax=Pseudonocardia parietis TaxID=570936 RepID=A0ABS4W238_9PSEU|nr:hypothetical protein [Pseudonocardia parietis]MBP2370236.1 hypothetical protein [Pseudonocardia parietis]